MTDQNISPALVATRLDASLAHVGLPAATSTHIECDGSAPGCRPAVGEAAAVALAAAGTATAELWQIRGGDAHVGARPELPNLRRPR